MMTRVTLIFRFFDLNSTQNVKNQLKIGLKWAQNGLKNGFKMKPKIHNGFEMDPKWTQNELRMDSNDLKVYFK